MCVDYVVSIDTAFCLVVFSKWTYALLYTNQQHVYTGVHSIDVQHRAYTLVVMARVLSNARPFIGATLLLLVVVIVAAFQVVVIVFVRNWGFGEGRWYA
jgi:hypothetical protein